MSAHFELRRAVDGSFLFNLKAGNGEVILTSGSYSSRSAATAGIVAVKGSAGKAERYTWEIAANERPYFLLTSPNGEVLGRSELYSSGPAMEKGIRSVMQDAREALVTDLATMEPAFASG